MSDSGGTVDLKITEHLLVERVILVCVVAFIVFLASVRDWCHRLVTDRLDKRIKISDKRPKEIALFPLAWHGKDG